MDFLPNAFDSPIWYIGMQINGASELLTQKQNREILAKRLNRDQRNALIKVEEYTILPDTIHLIIREVALTLEMWWPVFRDATARELEDSGGIDGVTCNWHNLTQELIIDAVAFERCAYDLLYQPVTKGYATDPGFYEFNSINNVAGIDL
ncbi:hypothetical protein SAMN05518672_109193 [Chitinophaga sp. CF118]|uniref:hypothetical protein n=1 Tax=Chitinophaga sp. CF118 TaxID=1884367 RepID=UPI0008E36A46|nr:hypothetical protein [Chitinophaga sp. CF118]SFE72450.1 hypothetical protein SAMN05518672_109193 [Chitinophaga sp. CF118]